MQTKWQQLKVLIVYCGLLYLHKKLCHVFMIILSLSVGDFASYDENMLVTLAAMCTRLLPTLHNRTFMMAMKRKLNEIFIAKTNASFDDTENI